MTTAIRHETLKSAIKRKHRVYNKYVKRGRKPDDWEYVQSVRNETSAKINKAKDDYFSDLSQKLSDPTSGIKSYWAALNKIINKKRFPNVPRYWRREHLSLISKPKQTFSMIILLSNVP